MNIPLPYLTPVVPELILSLVASGLLLVELFTRRKALMGYVSLATAGLTLYVLPMSQGETFGGMFISDNYSTYFKLIFLINVILIVLVSLKYMAKTDTDYGEYYSLVLFSTVGMMLMASAKNLIVLYLGLELMALSTYILTGINRHDVKSNEAALKYFLLGAFSSALLLFGMSLLYGITASTDIYQIASFLKVGEVTPVLLVSIIFVIVAFAFKIAAAPFHMWAPDVYEGAPTAVAAFLSVGPKAAGFAVIGRVFYIAFGSVQTDWTAVFIGISILTMAVGNILAIVQVNIKRMLAYSSIAHAGYALLGVIAGTSEGLSAMMVYLLIYAFMNIGAFAIVILLDNGEEISQYAGLAKSHPVAAAMMLVFMFSLTGIPPTAGFIGKFNLFVAVVHAGYTWLVIIAVLFSVISAFYYLRVIMNMYMRPATHEASITSSPSLWLALIVTVVAVLAIGILPSIVLTGSSLCWQ